MVDGPYTGLLHRLLNVAPDEEITQERLREATRTGAPNTRRLATVAHNVHLKRAKAAADSSGGKE